MSVPVRNDRVARYLEFVGRGDALEVLSARMMDGEGLREICRSMDIPQTRVLHWLMEDVGRWEVYERCLRVCADMEVEETVGIADGASAEEVGVAKLRIETRMRRAKHYDAKRFGDGGVEGSGMTVVVNRVGGAEGGVVIEKGGATVRIGDVGVGGEGGATVLPDGRVI